MSYTEKIKHYRKVKGLSQTEVANKTGISQAAYGKIESGFTKSITIETGKKLAEVLEISFNELFDIGSKESQEQNNLLKEQQKRLDEAEIYLNHYYKNYNMLYEKILVYKRYVYSSIKAFTDLLISIEEEKIKDTTNEKDRQKHQKALEHFKSKEKELFTTYIHLGLLTEDDLEKFEKDSSTPTFLFPDSKFYK